MKKPDEADKRHEKVNSGRKSANGRIKRQEAEEEMRQVRRVGSGFDYLAEESAE